MLRTALPDIQEPIFSQRFALAFELIIHSLANRERARKTVQKGLDTSEVIFVSNLVDCVAGIMTAPLSSATRSSLQKASGT
jgi:hypothetical protein